LLHSDNRQLSEGGFIVTMVAADGVEDAWPACHALIEASCRKGGAEFTAGQLRQECKAGIRQLWTIRQIGKGIVCAAVTSVMFFGGRKTVVWTALGGKNWDAWAHFEAIVAETAKHHGCEAIRGYCRRGWKRKLKDYREVGVILEREL
jgi:hypothetical protein